MVRSSGRGCFTLHGWRFRPTRHARRAGSGGCRPARSPSDEAQAERVETVDPEAPGRDRTAVEQVLVELIRSWWGLPLGLRYRTAYMPLASVTPVPAPTRHAPCRFAGRPFPSGGALVQARRQRDGTGDHRVSCLQEADPGVRGGLARGARLCAVLLRWGLSGRVGARACARDAARLRKTQRRQTRLMPSGSSLRPA